MICLPARLQEARDVYPLFLEFNLWLYHRGRGVFLDGVIWCLGPYVDHSPDYGVIRRWVAVATRRACRLWLGGAS